MKNYSLVYIEQYALSDSVSVMHHVVVSSDWLSEWLILFAKLAFDISRVHLFKVYSGSH